MISYLFTLFIIDVIRTLIIIKPNYKFNQLSNVRLKDLIAFEIIFFPQIYIRNLRRYSIYKKMGWKKNKEAPILLESRKSRRDEGELIVIED